MTNRKKREIWMLVWTIVGFLVVGGTIFLILSDSILYGNQNDKNHGSAGMMKGTTLVYTIFVSDDDYKWYVNNETDQENVSKVNDYLEVACKYLVVEAANFGVIPSFVADFKTHTDIMSSKLFEDVSFAALQQDTAKLDETMWSYIYNEIDYNGLMKKYNADNIVFVAVMNTDSASTVTSGARSWYAGMGYPFEVVYIPFQEKDEVTPPSVYAREILKCFGALDLTKENADYHVTQDTLAKLEEKLPNDIMRNTRDENGKYQYDSISNRITELTAYYIGISDTSDLREELGLSENEFAQTAE